SARFCLLSAVVEHFPAWQNPSGLFRVIRCAEYFFSFGGELFAERNLCRRGFGVRNFGKVLEVLCCGSLDKSRNRSLSVYPSLLNPMIPRIQSELSTLRVAAYLDRLSNRRSFFISTFY